jgi:hypothetical protein
MTSWTKLGAYFPSVLVVSFRVSPAALIRPLGRVKEPGAWRLKAEGKHRLSAPGRWPVALLRAGCLTPLFWISLMCNICNESPCYKELAKVSGISPAPWHSDTLHLNTHLAQNRLKLFSELDFQFSTAFPMVKLNMGPEIPSFPAQGNISANMHALPHKRPSIAPT